MCVSALLLCACGGGDEAQAQPPTHTTQLANPFTQCDDMESAQEGAGFEMSAPESVSQSGAPVIRVMKGYLIELIYGESEDEIRIRKALSADDISGDYSSYDDVSVFSVGEVEVTLKGSGGSYSVAVWTVGEYSFSITVGAPRSREFMLELAGFVS